MNNKHDFFRRIVNKKELLTKAASKFGTPLYFIDKEEIEKNIDRIKTAFMSKYRKVKIYYPYKTNDLPYICRIIHKKKIGSEISSLLELELAKKLGVKDIIFNGPGKTEEEIISAIENKVLIICDSKEEIEKVNSIAKKLKKNIGVGIRIQPTNIEDNLWNKFGITIKYLHKEVEKEYSNIEIEGFHFHIGTQIRDHKVICKAIKNVGNALKNINKNKLKSFKHFNIGGGFGVESMSFMGKKDFFVKYLARKNPFFIKYMKRKFLTQKTENINLIASKIVDSFKKNICLQFPKEIELRIEPGRFIVNSSTSLLLKVLYKKKNSIILNGGINLVPNIIYTYHPIINISKPSIKTTHETIYGPLCLTDDFFGNYYFGEKSKTGDLFCISNIGAYNINVSWQFIKPKEKIVILEENKLLKIREKEDFNYRYKRDTF
ncbi:hypothetical protein HQ533_04880 [Candidatus Woesearchaeota archaeon]|nr:hypothetical protein [Candidatus Woesearchaeota archaeon]